MKKFVLKITAKAALALPLAVLFLFLLCVPRTAFAADCSLEAKIKEAEKKLEKVKVKHAWKYDKKKKKSTPDVVSYEDEWTFFGEVFKKKITYFSWAEIALAVLDVKSCETEIIVVKRTGRDLIVGDPRFEIEIEKRLSGITWNGYNTPFLVKKPENHLVVANKYVTYKKGKPTRVLIYSPYSSSIHREELVKKGEVYLKGKIDEAYARLAKLKVKSKAAPDKLAAEVIPKEMVLAIALSEQIDPEEFFRLDRKRLAERVYARYGQNGSKAFIYVTSPAYAQGSMQIISSTYHSIRKKYPKARLVSDFNKGTSDDVNSVMAAVLLLDYNLSDIKKKFGEEILKDEKLEEYLAASYNTTVARVLKYIADKNLENYLPETKMYLEKYRYYRNFK